MAEKVRILTARPHRLLAPLIEELGRLNRQEKSVVLLVPEQTDPADRTGNLSPACSWKAPFILIF